MFKNIKYRIISPRTPVASLIISLLLIVSTVQLSAEDIDLDPESMVSIYFDPGDATIGPLDPDDPTQPGPDTGTPGGSGSLALNYVSQFYFGDQEISVQEEKYATLTQKPFIQVTDLRGSYEGWEVSARVSTFKNEDRESLQGATLSFYNASCISPSKLITAPTPQDPLTLPADGSTTKTVVTANSSEGMGTWLTRWYIPEDEDSEYEYPEEPVPEVTVPNESVILTVPGGSGRTGNNAATITWLLRSVPA